jgi:hypothetical protein
MSIDLGKSGERMTIPVPKSQVSAALVVSAVSDELAVVPWIEQIRTPGKDGVVINSFFPLGEKRDVDYRATWPRALSRSVKTSSCPARHLTGSRLRSTAPWPR